MKTIMTLVMTSMLSFSAFAAQNTHQVNLTSETIAKLSQISNTQKLSNTSISNYITAPAAGTQSFTVTPAFITKNDEYEIFSTDFSDKKNGTSLNFDFNKGLEDDMTLSVQVAAENYNGTSKTEGTSGNNYTQSGLSDITVNIMKMDQQTENQKFYGAFVTLSPDAKNTENSGNNYSGGHSFGAKYISQFNYAETVMGVKTQAQFLLGRTWITEESDWKWNGGHNVSAKAFVEVSQNSSIYGADLGLQHNLASDVKVSSTSADMSSHNALLIGAYGIFNIGKDIQIKPAVQFTQLVGESGGDISLVSSDTTAVSISAQVAL